MLRPAAVALLIVVGVLAQDSRPTPSDSDVRAAITRGTERLLELQEDYAETAGRRRRRAQPEAERPTSRKSGPEWPYEGVYRLQGVIPPGYRVGGTAICCRALLEAPGFDSDAPRRKAFLAGIAFILDALAKDPLMQSGFDGTYDVRGWGHTYALDVLLRAMGHNVLPDDVARSAEARVRALVKTLEETEIEHSGGWNYSRSGSKPGASPFMTAPTLQALFQARQAGFDVNARVIERALQTLEDARVDNGAFLYTTGSRAGRTDPTPGACARMAAAETSLLLAGRGSIARVRTAVLAFFEHWHWLEARRRQTGTHEPPHGIAPYYFHYGHTYVAQAIELLPQDERPALRARLRALYWATREPSGGWNDRVFPRSEAYGTAMALLGLMMPDLPTPASYPAGKTGR